MSESFARDVPGGSIVTVRIHPGARRTAVAGIHNGALKISLTTPPVDGRANEALIGMLAEALGLPKARLDLLTGVSGRTKTFRVTGKSAAEVQAALDPTRSC